MEKLNFIISKRLGALRRESGLTQLELAEKLNYSDKAVSKWELGESIPSVEVLYKLSKLYNVSLDYIVGEESQIKQNSFPKRPRKKLNITFLAIIAVWLVALVFYIAFDIFAKIKLWLLFCWAVPASCVVIIVFDSIWNRHRFLFLFISLLVWSFLICFSLQFIGYNIWQILLIGIPLQIATVIWSRMMK